MLDLRSLNRALLARQLLLERSSLPPLAAIERLVAMQAQVAAPPFVGLWTRLAAFDRPALHALLHDRRVVRATFLRRTLHLLSAADYIALRPALQPMLSAGMHAILKERTSGLDLDALSTFARGHLPATFDRLRPLLQQQFPRFDERALGYAVRMCLPLVQVPTPDPWSFPASSSFADAGTWLSTPISTSATDAATDSLVLRYLAAFGPATIRDAQRWSGIPSLTASFARLRPSLIAFRDDRSRELFDLPDAPRPPPETPAPVRLVPDFDNLVLGHDDRRRIVSDTHRPHLSTKNLLIKATFLVDGFVAGTWRIDRTRTASTLTLSPFAPLSRPTRASLHAEATSLLSFTDPDAPAHTVSFAAPSA